MRFSEVRTICFSISKNVDRHERLSAMLTARGFRNWEIFLGREVARQDYPRAAKEDYSALLKTLTAPVIILEDDVVERTWRDSIEIPAGTDVAYLGAGGRF